MTPKEKAKELVDKFKNRSIELGETNSQLMAEANALIAVDEMLKEHFGDISDYGTRRYYFLKEVKQEIEKL